MLLAIVRSLAPGPAAVRYCAAPRNENPALPVRTVATEMEPTMLWTIAVILLILWALGFFAFHVAGGLIHILIVLAIIVGLIQLFSGRRV